MLSEETSLRSLGSFCTLGFVKSCLKLFLSGQILLDPLPIIFPRSECYNERAITSVLWENN
jgi:hypothetical protein